MAQWYLQGRFHCAIFVLFRLFPSFPDIDVNVRIWYHFMYMDKNGQGEKVVFGKVEGYLSTYIYCIGTGDMFYAY